MSSPLPRSPIVKSPPKPRETTKRLGTVDIIDLGSDEQSEMPVRAPSADLSVAMDSNKSRTTKSVAFVANTSNHIPRNSKVSKDSKDEKRKRPNFLDSQTMVTVKVTSSLESKTFPVHKSFLCFYSPYFEQAFNGASQESEERMIHLPDVTPITFSIFQNWVYTQQIVEANNEIPQPMELVDLWILAQKARIPRLQNQAIDLLEQTYGLTGWFSPSILNRIYSKIGDHNRLRMYVVLRMVESAYYMRQSTLWPRELLVDLFNARTSRYDSGRSLFSDSTMELFHV